MYGEVIVMADLLTVYVALDGADSVAAPGCRASMVRFHGSAEGSGFHGEILPGGVDTQTFRAGEPGRLSARYMLEGTDADGQPCRVFIENNGEAPEGAPWTTRPMIVTDSPSLRKTLDVPLRGSIEDAGEGRVTIHIFEDVGGAKEA